MTENLTNRIHELKTWCDPFEAILKGAKTFEIRKNDRGFAVGDTLLLREWDERSATYTGRSIERVVTYLASGWGLPDDLCVMAIQERDAAYLELTKKVADLEEDIADGERERDALRNQLQELEQARRKAEADLSAARAALSTADFL